MRRSVMKKRNIIFIAFIFLISWVFNIKSNAHILFDNNGLLYNTGKQYFDMVGKNDIYELSKLNLWRRNTGITQRCMNKVSRPQLYLLKVKTKEGFKVALSEDGYVTTDLKKGSNNVSINSSFYERDFSFRGEVVIDGIKKGKISNSSGYFKVIDRKAIIGPTSTFKNLKGHVDFSCQAHPSIMKNGIIWDYIIDETKNQSYWKQKTYRSLVGEDDEGNICFLVSGNGGLISIKEISLIAKQQGMQHAIMLDAGAALQYSIELTNSEVNFSSWNNKLNLGRTVDKLFRKVTGQRFYSSSPVFITHNL